MTDTKPADPVATETAAATAPAPATVPEVSAPTAATDAAATAPSADPAAPTVTTTDSIPATQPKETTETEKAPIAQLWIAAQAHGHPEIWGVPLSDPETHIPSQVIFQKYLNANDGDLAKAKDQLIKTLDWRAKTKPQDLVHRSYSKSKFEGLGFVTIYTAEEESEPEHKEVFTWNQYGGVKSIDETFGDLDE